MISGYVLWEDDDVVCIVTGVGRPSENPKTGQMLQAWVLVKKVDPIRAQKLGLDVKICFDCQFRYGTCYVNWGQAPLTVWNAWKRGSYPKLKDFRLLRMHGPIRLGAAGDPAAVPVSVWDRAVAECGGHTGYTHQWRTRPDLQHLVMASCDSLQDQFVAEAMGWRTFRVKHSGASLLKGEISCPASEESGHKTTCAACQLCNGSGKAKSIAINVHGKGKKRFE